MATKLKTKKAGQRLPLQAELRNAKEIAEAGPLATAAKSLGIPGTRQWRGLTAELAELKAAHSWLAGVYEKAATESLNAFKPREFLRRWQAKWPVAEVKRKAREEIYRFMGIELKPLSEQIKQKLDASELIESDSLFRMLVYGDLRRRVLEMAGIENPIRIEVERMFASAEVFRVTVADGNQTTRIFVDDTGVEADILAAELLKEAGIIVPEMKNIHFRLPNGEESEFGVMQDIADAEGVKNVVSLRAIARDERMSKLVLEDLDRFSEMLGYALEVCRMLGIQDRHDRNMFVIEKTDGTLAIGMIDLDIVACYPTEERFQEAFAGQLHHILDSLYFASRFGESVRIRPAQIKEEMRNEAPEDAREHMGSISNAMAGIFLKGAERARSFYMRKKNLDRVKLLLKQHDGRPVGWGIRGKRYAELREKKERLLEESRKTKRRARINGGLPRIISQGPHKGRIKLNSTDAWRHGFKVMLKGEEWPDGNPAKRFWEKTFGLWNLALPVWVRKEGPLIPIATIAY